MTSAPPKTAGIIAPPPVLYLGALLMGFMIHAFSPQPILASVPAHQGLGVLFIVASGALARWSFVTMRQLGTTANPREHSTALAIRGPFRLSRNPIYLAMTGLYLGISFFVNSWWPLVLLVPLLLVMQWGVVLREDAPRRHGLSLADY